MSSSSSPEETRSFITNRAKYPLDELEKYAGKFVAWSPDGTHIVASSEDEAMLDDLVRNVGEDPAQCVVGWVSADDALLGGL